MGRRAGIWVLVLVVVLGVFGAGAAWKNGAFQGTPPAFCPESVESDTTAGTYELPGRAAPYAGGAPHPLLIFDVFRSEPRFTGDWRPDGDLKDVTAGLKGLPPGWRAASGAEPGIQLIVCRYRHGIGEAAEIGRCRNAVFTSSPVLAVTYTYRVYEAATAKLLGRFDLPGTAYECPEWMNRRPEQIPDSVLPEPDPAQVVERLRPFAEPATAG